MRRLALGALAAAVLLPASSASAASCDIPSTVTTQTFIENLTTAKTPCNTAVRVARGWDNSDLCRSGDDCGVKASGRWKCRVVASGESSSAVRCTRGTRRVRFTSQL